MITKIYPELITLVGTKPDSLGLKFVFTPAEVAAIYMGAHLGDLSIKLTQKQQHYVDTITFLENGEFKLDGDAGYGDLRGDTQTLVDSLKPSYDLMLAMSRSRVNIFSDMARSIIKSFVENLEGENSSLQYFTDDDILNITKDLQCVYQRHGVNFTLSSEEFKELCRQQRWFLRGECEEDD